MTDPILRPAGLSPPRVLAGIVAAAALLHMSSASASPAGNDFAAHFDDYRTLAEPVIPTEAVDMDSLGSIGTPPEAQIEGDPVEQTLGEGMASFYGSELAGREDLFETFVGTPRDLDLPIDPEGAA